MADTEPAREALRRAGVSEDRIKTLLPSTILARGTVLLRQEEVVAEAVFQMKNAVENAERFIHDQPNLIDLRHLSGAVLIQELMHLQGLREGIEFVTGSGADSGRRKPRNDR